MELNRRTKAVGGVLAFALAALLVDRVIGYGPQSASAAPAPGGSVLTEREAPRARASSPERNHGALSARLKALKSEPLESSGRDNAFVAPVAWFPVDEEVEQKQVAAPRKALREHQLTTVLSSKERGIYAVRVDGKLLQPGVPVLVDSPNGKYELEFVGAELDKRTGVVHVDVKVDGERVTLTAGNKDK